MKANVTEITRKKDEHQAKVIEACTQLFCYMQP
jgi:hypothetical protein